MSAAFAAGAETLNPFLETDSRNLRQNDPSQAEPSRARRSSAPVALLSPARTCFCFPPLDGINAKTGLNFLKGFRVIDPRSAVIMVARTGTILYHEGREGSCCSHPSPPPWDPAEDLSCITTTFQYLQASGWYWGSISAGEAREALLTKSEGTFLLRDSSHPKFMLALSVKTRCGPTSVRIDYNRGCFWLDSVSRGAPHLKSFSDVLSLIQHYTVSGQTAQDLASFKTKPDPLQVTAKDAGVPLKLVRPLHRQDGFPSLQHLARLTINKQTNCPDQLPLPKPLLHFLQNYPFFV